LPSPAEQIRRQEADERRILAVVKCLRAAYAIPDDQVFLTGWSAGNFAVLHTGLKHPDVFRALAIRQGNFDERFFEPLVPQLDRHQPIMVSWGAIDFLKSQSRTCYEWLRAQGMDVEMREITGGHRRHPQVAFDFFLHCVRTVPWVQLHADAVAEEPMAVRCRMRTSPPGVRFAWDFGDGERSQERSPKHVYTEPGTYQITGRVKDRAGRVSTRTATVAVPREWVASAE
jgi:pimeloyl-ACP methyl ester carboxylesterase